MKSETLSLSNEKYTDLTNRHFIRKKRGQLVSV